MVCTNLAVGKSRHHIVLVISKLAWSVNTFLHISILALKLFYFPFDYVLHKVFLLTHILSFNYLISCFVISRLEVERSLWIAVKSVVSNYLVTGIWKLWRWLQANAAWLTTVVEWIRILARVHFIIKLRRLISTWIVLNSLSTSTV